MLINQYKSRRQWHLLPSDTKTPVVIVWWKVTESKRAEELKVLLQRIAFTYEV